MDFAREQDAERDRLLTLLDEALTRERAQLITHNLMAGNLRIHDTEREQLREQYGALLAALEAIMGSRRVGNSIGELHLAVNDDVLDSARAAIALAKAGA